MTPAECPACRARPRWERFGRYRDEEYFTTSEEFDYWRCEECGSVTLHPLPLNRLREIYPPNYYSFTPAAGAGLAQHVKRWLDARHFRRIMRRFDRSDLSVLDVGGGTGWLLDLVREIDPRVRHTQVVDLDPAAAAEARAKGHEYACQRIEEFETSRRFAVVLLMNIIEHVESPRELLTRVAHLLAPDGVVVVKTPNVDSLDARVFRGNYWAGLHVPRHWVLFTRSSFERALAGTGLKIRDFSYTQGAPFWAASVLAAWQRRGWVSISRERPAFYHPAFAPLAALFAVFDQVRAFCSRTSQMHFTLELEETQRAFRSKTK